MECHLGPDLRPVGNDSPGDEHGPLCREDDEHHCRTQFAPCERECPDDGARKRTRAPTRGTSMDLFLRFRVRACSSRCLEGKEVGSARSCPVRWKAPPAMVTASP